MPAIAPRSLRGHGTTHTAVDGAGVLERRRRRRRRWRRPRRAPSRAGPTPPVTVMRTRASGQVVGRAAPRPSPPRSSSSSNGHPQVEAVGGAPEPVEVAAGGERPPSTALSVSKTPSPTVRPWSKIETVASVGGHQRPVRARPMLVVHRHDPDATRRRRRALSSVSAHSSSGSLSQVMPPPVPKWSCPSSTQKVRMATLRSPCAAVGVDPADRAAVDAAGHRLERGDLLEGGDLRRAGDRARAGTSPRWRRPTRSRAGAGRATVDTRCTRPGWCSRASSAGHLDRAEVAHPAEVVADEVDDHHVLGAVLGRQAVGVRGGALDRRRDSTTSPSRRQEPLGRRRGHLAAGRGDAHHGAVRRRVALGQRRARGRPRRRPAGSGAESRRVRFTWYTSPAAIDARMRRTPGRELGLGRASCPGVGGRALATAARARAGRAARGRTGRRSAAPSNGQHHGPEPGGVEGGQVVGEVDQLGRQPAADHRQRDVGGDGSGHGGSVRSRLVPAVTRSIPGRPSPPVHVEFTEEHDALRKVVRDFAEARDRAARRGVGPRPPLPGRRRAGDGRARAVRHPVPGGVRRRRRRPHDAVHRHRGAGPGRPLDGHHPRGGRRPRRQPDPPVRHRGAEADLAARPLRRAHARRASASPSRRRAATPAAPAPPPCSTRRRGSG